MLKEAVASALAPWPTIDLAEVEAFASTSTRFIVKFEGPNIVQAWGPEASRADLETKKKARAASLIRYLAQFDSRIRGYLYLSEQPRGMPRLPVFSVSSSGIIIPSFEFLDPRFVPMPVRVLRPWDGARKRGILRACTSTMRVAIWQKADPALAVVELVRTPKLAAKVSAYAKTRRKDYHRVPEGMPIHGEVQSRSEQTKYRYLIDAHGVEALAWKLLTGRPVIRVLWEDGTPNFWPDFFLEDGKHYIVATPDTLNDTIRRLQQEPERVQEIGLRGQRRAKKFLTGAVAHEFTRHLVSQYMERLV